MKTKFATTLLICVLMLSMGCSSTRFTPYSSYPKFLNSESILVLPVDELNTNSSYGLYQTANDQLRTPSNRVLYFPEIEYDLIKEGIDKELLADLGQNDSVNQIVNRILQVDHLLDVRLTDSFSSESSIGSYTETELNEHNAHYYQDGERRRASLLFTFTNLKDNTSRKFLVSTSIDPISFDDRDGGETRVNLASLETAIGIAYEKGLKKIRKGMITE